MTGSFISSSSQWALVGAAHVKGLTDPSCRGFVLCEAINKVIFKRIRLWRWAPCTTCSATRDKIQLQYRCCTSVLMLFVLPGD
eukprot:1160098-Pelagomonas_calceolata.AAC.5